MRKLTREDLRQMGRLALEMRFDHSARILDVRGPGIIPGGRLKIVASLHESIVAVRTSPARELGFARRPEGRWVTLPKVDEVLVVVPVVSDAEKAEVLAYDARTLIEAFDAALAAQGEESSKRFSTAPVFIALDGEPTVTSGLKSKAKWQMVVKRSELSKRQQAQPSATAAFLERVKREYAEMSGVDVNKVVIEFKIIT